MHNQEHIVLQLKKYKRNGKNCSIRNVPDVPLILVKKAFATPK